jgi:hypothetical protein
MPRKQVGKILRTKKVAISQDQIIMEETATEEIEIIEESEKWTKNCIIEERKIELLKI